MVTKHRIAEKFEKNKGRNKKAATSGETEEEKEAPVLLVTHVNDILHLICSTVEVYVDSEHFHKSNGLYAHKVYYSTTSRETSLNTN